MIFIQLILAVLSIVGPTCTGLAWGEFGKEPGWVRPYQVVAGVLAVLGFVVVPWLLAIIDEAEGRRRVLGIDVVSCVVVFLNC